MIQYLVLLGAFVNLLGTFAYLKDTLSGKTRPNRVSWLMWTIAPFIATVAAISDGVKWAILPTFMAGFCPLLVFVASFINKKAYWKLEKFDYLCGLFSALALIFWAITKDPVIAIVFAIASDGFACIPTLVEAWRYPETETGISYVASIFNALTSFAAIRIWSFPGYGFGLYLFIANSLFTFSIYRKKLIKI
jgi:hypothetical protein